MKRNKPCRADGAVPYFSWAPLLPPTRSSTPPVCRDQRLGKLSGVWDFPAGYIRDRRLPKYRSTAPSVALKTPCLVISTAEGYLASWSHHAMPWMIFPPECAVSDKADCISMICLIMRISVKRKAFSLNPPGVFLSGVKRTPANYLKINVLGLQTCSLKQHFSCLSVSELHNALIRPCFWIEMHTRRKYISCSWICNET